VVASSAAADACAPQQDGEPLTVAAGAPQQLDCPTGKPTDFLTSLTNTFSFGVDMPILLVLKMKDGLDICFLFL
jgi:hypothetical protein